MIVKMCGSTIGLLSGGSFSSGILATDSLIR